MFINRLFLLEIESEFKEVIQLIIREYVRFNPDQHNFHLTRKEVHKNKFFSVIKLWVGPFGL